MPRHRPLPPKWRRMQRKNAESLAALKRRLVAEAKAAADAAERAKRQAYWAKRTPKPREPEKSPPPLTAINRPRADGRSIFSSQDAGQRNDEARWIADNGWSGKQ
jgi:hypothetical protein